MSTTTFDNLEPHERLRVWWAFVWRGLVMTVCSILGGGIAGFVLGIIIQVIAAILRRYGHDPDVHLLIRILGGAAGFAFGLFFYWQYLRWIFRVRLAGFRLLLVREPSGAAV